MGDAGSDSLFGGEGNDILHGNNGDDLLWGGDGDDRLDGGAPNRDDRLPAVIIDLTLLDGADSIYGGTGNDTLTGSLGDDLLNDDMTYEELDNFSKSSPNVRLGLMGNVNVSAAFVTARVGDSTLILDFEKNEVFFRGQINNNPIENLPILKAAGLNKVLKLNSANTAVDAFIDLDQIDNSEISFHSLVASLTVDFDKGVELKAKIETPIIDVKVEGSVKWNGDVYLVGQARAGTSFDIEIAEVDVKMELDVVIAGNFYRGTLQVDAALNFSFYGMASIDFWLFSADFGAKGSASARLKVSLEDFKDFQGSLSVRADFCVYLGAGPISVGSSGRIIIDSRGLLVDFDHIPTFRIG